jgi:hypothetical protein
MLLSTEIRSGIDEHNNKFWKYMLTRDNLKTMGVGTAYKQYTNYIAKQKCIAPYRQVFRDEYNSGNIRITDVFKPLNFIIEPLKTNWLEWIYVIINFILTM